MNNGDDDERNAFGVTRELGEGAICKKRLFSVSIFFFFSVLCLFKATSFCDGCGKATAWIALK